MPLFIDAVAASIARQLEAMPRKAVIRASLENRGALIQVAIWTKPAPSLTASLPNILNYLSSSRKNGSIKSGTPGRSFSDDILLKRLAIIVRGPTTYFPPPRTARFSSPLGVYDFQKRSSIIQVSERASAELGRIASILAHGEGFQAHAMSAEYRFQNSAATVTEEIPALPYVNLSLCRPGFECDTNSTSSYNVQIT